MLHKNCGLLLSHWFRQYWKVKIQFQSWTAIWRFPLWWLDVSMLTRKASGDVKKKRRIKSEGNKHRVTSVEQWTWIMIVWSSDNECLTHDFYDNSISTALWDGHQSWNKALINWTVVQENMSRVPTIFTYYVVDFVVFLFFIVDS